MGSRSTPLGHSAVKQELVAVLGAEIIILLYYSLYYIVICRSCHCNVYYCVWLAVLYTTSVNILSAQCAFLFVNGIINDVLIYHIQYKHAWHMTKQIEIHSN